MSIIYLDGEFLLEADAKISVLDRGFLFGDGAYTTIKVKEGRACFLDLHLQRLRGHCLSLGIVPPKVSPLEIEQFIEKRGASQGEWRLRILATGGKDSAMRLPQNRSGHLIMTLQPFTPLPYGPLQLGIFPYPIMHCHASFKSLAHLNRYYVMEYAHQKGWDDAISCTESGMVLEAAFGNLVWMHQNRVYTPDPLQLPLHFGVTVTVLLEIFQREGWEVHKIRVGLAEISEDAYLFRTNTMSEIRPIERIEEKIFARDEDFEEWICQKYQEAMHTSIASLSFRGN